PYASRRKKSLPQLRNQNVGNPRHPQPCHTRRGVQRLAQKNLRRLQLSAPPRSDRRPPPDSEKAAQLFLPRRTFHARPASAFREHHRTRSRRPALFFPERLRPSRDADRWSSSMLGDPGARQQSPRRHRSLSRNRSSTQR